MMHSDQKRNGILSLAVALGTTLGATGALSQEIPGPVVIPDKGKLGVPGGSFIKWEATDAAFSKVKANVKEATFLKIETNFYKLLLPAKGVPD